MFGSHDKLLLWIYPHNPTYGGVYFTTIFLKTKSQLPNQIKTLLKARLSASKHPKTFFEIQ